MSHYTRRNMSRSTQAFSSSVFRLLAGICESVVFVYIGEGVPVRVHLSPSASVVFVAGFVEGGARTAPIHLFLFHSLGYPFIRGCAVYGLQ